MAANPLDWTTDALATYRLTRLIVEDQVAAPIRNAAYKRYGNKGIGYLVECPWCTSAWVGLAVATARRVAPRTWGLVAQALAFSAVAGLVSEHG